MIFRFQAMTQKRSGLLMTALFAAVPALFFAGTPGWGAEEQAGQAVPSAQAAAPQKIPFPKPDSHRGDWLDFHGRTVAVTGNAADVSGKTCLVCHEKNDCVSCHNTRMPRDHRSFWRTRGHGLMAGAEPERCLICHKQDYCVSCHNETAPRTHVGMWNAPSPAGTPGRPTHCTWCHFDGGVTPADNCVVCHKQAPHATAPHPVSGAMNCTLCH